MATEATTKWDARQIPSLTGELALITGANSGIGFWTAVELARHGAEVLLGCRNAEKGLAALNKLKAEIPNAKAHVVELDMASLTSIRAFAASFVSSGAPLDILVNNAGVMAIAKRELTVDGFEQQFGTNHLGHFALTGLLLPALLKSPAPRVVTVASLAHRGGKIEFDNLQSERQYAPWDAYNNSKLANILFANELDRRAKAASSRLISLAVHPGISKTNIFQNGLKGKDFKSVFMSLFGGPLMQDDKMGALPTLYAATAPEAKGGQYIGPDGFMEFKGYPKVVEPKPHAKDTATGEKLWEASEKLTGVTYPPLT
jgi:NAD(P)-dependent dehydrogenase (short-subunit alcohol dehydrogenase family)